MSSLAVSFLLLGTGGGQLPPPKIRAISLNSQFQYRQRAVGQSSAYVQLSRSVVSLVSKAGVSGTAVLIDKAGLYLAAKDSASTQELEGVFENGQRGHLSYISQDPWTQTVLLRSDYVPGNAEPVTPVSETPAGTPLLILVQGGTIPARVVSDTRVGLVKPSNRMVPLCEVRFELPENTPGHAPVFTSSGQFLGFLSASLSTNSSVMNQSKINFAAGGARSSIPAFGGGHPQSNFIGPADLTVAYLPSTDAMKVAFEGFLSGSHSVEHPAFGVFCTDGAGGALIREVVPDSPADQIGLREHDLITGMGIYLVRSKSDFAKVLFKLKPGMKAIIRFDRDGKTFAREATLGKSAQ